MDNWFFHDAKWWQFWWPQSSFMGGVIAGALLYGINYAIEKLRS